MAWDEDAEKTKAFVHSLTPLDIHNKEFKRSFRGYNEDEVDEFLDLIVAEFERMMRVNEELQSEVAELESRVQHYKGLEETLKNSIVLAQKTADQVREAASKEADAIKRQAMLEADRMRDQAQEALKKGYAELEQCRSKILRYKAEMRAYLESQMEMVDKGTETILKHMEEELEPEEL